MMPEQEAAKAKKEMRSMILNRRRAMDAAALAELSLLAQNNLLAQDAWKKAQSVAIYKSTQNEVDTDLLLAAAAESGKSVYLPRVRQGTKGEMDFALCRGPRDLAPGAYGILEPDPARCPACLFTKHDACPPDDDVIVPPPDIFIIPGVAFDRKGQRLGFGGGYYDRFLSSPVLRGHSLFVGFAYSFQIVDSIAAEKWDQPVDALCSDAGYESFGSRR